MPRRIILDTDLGTDIDDAYALAFILASPDLELVGVTIANGRTEQRARLALKMLYEAGREDIPVAVGRPTDSGGTVNQAPWAEDFDAVQPIDQPAAEFIAEQVKAHPDELCLLPIGPLTDALAEMLSLWPSTTPVLHDPLAVGVAIDPTCCGMANLCVVCDEEGYTRPVEGEPNVQVAVTPNVGRFLHLFMERLLGQELRRSQ
jgi:inosine-uridine nucleoside N-ribohydrolase